MSEEEQRELEEWIASRPQVIQEMIERVPFNGLYRNMSYYRAGGRHQLVTITGYNEDGTVSISATCNFNLHSFDRGVFGIDIYDLEPTELPEDGTPIGCAAHGVARFQRSDWPTEDR